MDKRKKWHLANKEKAWHEANKRCQKCEKLTTPLNASIHHLKYLPHCYEEDVCVIEMMDNNICKWLCRTCHEETHEAKNFKESREVHEKKSGYCFVCGKYAYACWDRAVGIGIKKCLCRSCFKDHKKDGGGLYETSFSQLSLKL